MTNSSFLKFSWIGGEEKEDISGVATFSYKGIEVTHRFECLADALNFKDFMEMLYNNGYSDGLDASIVAIKREKLNMHKTTAEQF